MKAALYIVAVVLLGWLILPTLSFAEIVEKSTEAAKVISKEVKSTAEELAEAIDAVEPEESKTETVDDLIEKASKGTLKVSNIWAKPTLKGQTVGAAYMSLENPTDKAIALISAQASVAGRVEIHTHIHRDGVMQMRELQRLDVLAGDSKVFEPGGLHLMLFDLKKALEAGDSFELKLDFSNGTSKTLKVTVRNAG